MSDDDWFERALREDDDADAGDGDEEPDSPDEEGVGSADDAETPDWAMDLEEGSSSADTTDGDEAFGPEDAPGDEASGASTGDSEQESGDDPFGEDFASALENAPDPTSGGVGGQGGGDPFGGQGGGDPFGGQGEGDGFGFGDDSFGGGEPGGTEDFDEADFESDIERLDIGVEGLDEMILGGMPAQSLIAAVGSAGTGKTTLGLQFLRESLQQDERGVYITLEESRQRILDSADEKGWDFSAHEAEGRLAVLDLDPIEMANSLSSIQNDLPRLVQDFGAERLVLDSVSLLEMMYDQPARRRSEVFGFTRALKEAGVTILMTSEASQSSAYTSRYGIIEYLADAVLVLQYVRPSDFRETRLAIEIQKIRDANHSRETKPYELTDEGISVYRQANIF